MLRVTKIYKWMIVTLGATTLAYSGYWLPKPRFDWRLLMLTGGMIFLRSKLSVQIPRVNTNVTVSDTFIFLVLLVYRGFAAMLQALAPGLFGGLRLRGQLAPR